MQQKTIFQNDGFEKNESAMNVSAKHYLASLDILLIKDIFQSNASRNNKMLDWNLFSYSLADQNKRAGLASYQGPLATFKAWCMYIQYFRPHYFILRVTLLVKGNWKGSQTISIGKEPSSITHGNELRHRYTALMKTKYSGLEEQGCVSLPV